MTSDDKIKLHAAVTPEKLKQITPEVYIGINLVENNGLNQYYSLANKFFDYIHAGDSASHYVVSGI